MKKVQVSMTDHCHSVLKDYANAFGMTMSEVLYEATRHHIHKSSLSCGFVRSLFSWKKVTRDKRLNKDCYGFHCFSCDNVTACKTGVYKGTWEMNPKVRQFMDQHTSPNVIAIGNTEKTFSKDVGRERVLSSN